MDVDQLGGGTVAQLLGDRAREALEGALDDVLVQVLDQLRRGAQHDETRAVAQRADLRAEELVEAHELVDRGDTGGVEDRAAQLLGAAGAAVVNDEVVVREQFAHGLDEAALAAEEDGAGERGLTGLVAAQDRRLRQAEAAGQEGAGARLHEGRVEIRAGCIRHVRYLIRVGFR